MAAPTSRQVNKREAVDLKSSGPVQLQEQRRFFSSRGNDRATRQAQALTSVFTKGADLVNERAVQDNLQGRKDALGARASGADRAEENANAGYNAAWDQMDAEADLNLAKKELPAYLEKLNAESLSEEALQGEITKYMQEMFDGVDPTGHYGQALGPGLLALEQDILGTHRDQQLQAIQTDQRETMHDNLGGRWEASAELDEDGEPIKGTEQFDYEYLAAQTNKFFDGSNKKVVYWESLYDFAIKNGRPDLIENAPDRFTREDGKPGDPTGINDPLMADSHRAAIQQARASAGKLAAVEAGEMKSALNAKALDLIVATNAGVPATAEMIQQYASMPGADASVTAALSKPMHQLNNNAGEREADQLVVAQLTEQLYRNTLDNPMRAIADAFNRGELGAGKYGSNQMQELMALAKGNESVFRGGANENFKFLDADIDARYPVMRGPMGQITNPLMGEINRQAHLEFRKAKAEGGAEFDATKTWEDITERYDARRERMAPQAPLQARPKADVITDFLSNKATNQELQAAGLTGADILSDTYTPEQQHKLIDAMQARF